MSRLGRCWYLADLQRTKLPFLPLFISPAFPECPLVLWGGFCGRPHKVGYCRLLLTSVVPPSAPLLWWPIKLQGSDQNVSIDLNVQLSKTAHKSLKCKNEMKFPKEHPLNWQMDKKETKKYLMQRRLKVIQIYVFKHLYVSPCYGFLCGG